MLAARRLKRLVWSQRGHGDPWRGEGRRMASTAAQALSPLAAAFNARPLSAAQRARQRVSRDSGNRGLFLIPELTSADGFSVLRKDCVRRSAELVREACNPNRTRLVAAVFDDLSDELCRVADMAEFVRQAHPEADVAAAAEKACIEISGLVESLNTHIGLYGALEKAVEHGDRFPETDVDQHVAKLFLLDFKQCGIHLDDDARKMVVGLNDNILQIGQQFAYGCHQSRRVPQMSIPAEVRHLFNADGDSVVLNGLNVDSTNAKAREAAYKAYYGHNPTQERLLSELLTQRHHLAQMCGYETYAHRATAESLAANPERAKAFLSHLSEGLKTRVADDFVTLLNIKKHADPFAQALDVWDVHYFTAQAKNSWFHLHNERISEYFSLGVCMEGLNTIFKAIFGVELVLEDPEPGELWHNDVYKMAVRDVGNGGGYHDVLGHIYCDFFTRPGKPHQDCHFTIRGGRQRADGSYQNPVVVLMLNLSPPNWLSPTLLNGAAIDNLFHEMGHAMHSMLARTKYQHVTGTRCSTDFAEVPSTLMEYFASDPAVLAQISQHYKTGEQLPLSLTRKFCAAKKAFCSVELHTQLFYSMVDQEYHGGMPDPKGTTTDVVARLHGQHHPLTYHEGTAWQHRFSHLVGYGARYYSYLMARAVAASVWQKLFREEPLSPDNGTVYRRECLAHGGGKPSGLLVTDLLGQSPEPAMLAEAVLEEVDRANANMREVL